MSRQLVTLWQLNEAEQRLDITRSLIEFTRRAHPNDQLLQLELDRRQALIDKRITQIEMAKLAIASSN